MDRNWAVVHLDTVNHPGGESVAKGDRSLAILTGNDEIPVSRLNFWHGDLSWRFSFMSMAAAPRRLC
jgi:hypothetical protein